MDSTDADPLNGRTAAAVYECRNTTRPCGATGVPVKTETDPVALIHAETCEDMAGRAPEKARRAWLQAAAIWRLCPRYTRDNAQEAVEIWRTAELVHARAIKVHTAHM
jgi:hypothetical protein